MLRITFSQLLRHLLGQYSDDGPQMTFRQFRKYYQQDCRCSLRGLHGWNEFVILKQDVPNDCVLFASQHLFKIKNSFPSVICIILQSIY